MNHTPAPSGSLRSPAMVAAALVAAVCIAVSMSYKIYDPDIWENLVVGKAIWTLRQIPKTQLWSWPTYGAPDVKHHDERQPRVLGGAGLVRDELVPAEQVWKQDRVPEARDGE